MLKSPEFDASYDLIVTKSKGMQKSPEFHTTDDPIVTKSKGMLKSPDFHVLYRVIQEVITCCINFDARKFTKYIAK